MRLSTIWTLPTLSTMERLRRTRVWALTEAAIRLEQAAVKLNAMR